MTKDEYDVLVIGAGPSGLMMAAELVRYGLTCKIIDKKNRPSDNSRALAIQPRTLETIHFLGLSGDFLQNGKKISRLNPMAGWKRLGHIDLSELDSPFPFILSLAQSDTERILENYLEGLHCKVERSTELVGLQELQDVVVSELQGPSKEKAKIQTKWVIGCDGAHSFVRKYLNLSFLGKTFYEVFSIADVEMKWKYQHEEVYAFFHEKGILATIPFREKNKYRLIFQLANQKANTKENPSLDNATVNYPVPTLEEVIRIVHEFADPKAVISNPEWITNFHVNSRLIKRYQVGKFFLVGDAAHIHSPIGGQGMNTGLQEAFNLAWKIALVHKKQIAPRILESYHQERYAVAKQLLRGTEMGTHFVMLKKPWQRSIRNFLLSFILKMPSLKLKLMRAVSQIHIRYPYSSLITEKSAFLEGPKAGCRMPNQILQDAHGKKVEIFSLLQKPDAFYVFLFSGKKKHIKELEQLARSIGNFSFPLHIFLICFAHPTKNAQAKNIFFDPIGRVHQSFGAKRSAAYVVRPDTYIGYRETPIDKKALIAYLGLY